MDTTQLPTNRADAMARGATHYFTGTPCKRGHVAPRETKGNCTECRREDAASAADVRHEYFRAYNRRDYVKDRKHEWYVNNSKAVAERANARPYADKARYRKAWKDRNVDYVRADTKARRRKHRDATPPWLTDKQKKDIREIYRVAIELTRTTGVQYVVDHIFPLRSPTSCGLHVPWNLMVMPQEDNLTKSNKVPAHGALAFYPGVPVG